MRWCLGVVSSVLEHLIVGLVMLYRVTLGPVMGGHCRFHPTCSQYMLDAVQKHGPVRGVLLGLRRLARCHPFGGSGYDPP
ncbi:membrane protein insertion efficiency factor YidD [Mucisphaera sp.]|uniref:membrane protein insertion efficiency factor YidD n=1 Tax=Mucisphaera sp. TaxID=2913024 RepID=UPI003D0C8ACF